MQNRQSKKSIAILIAIFLIIIASSIYFSRHSNNSVNKNFTLGLLVQNNNPNPAWIAGWKNAASEEGIQLKVITDSDLLRSQDINPREHRGIILPDTLHATISKALVQKLKNYVETGGQLMLVYDAGTRTPGGTYYDNHSPFSEMVGINYAIFSRVGNSPTVLSYVGQDKAILDKLGIPPGKSVASYTCPCPHPNFRVISGYGYGALTYSHFVTTGDYSGTPLLLSPTNQLIAGINSVGKGKVLFVNLPLTYLWSQTDSMLMHTFLRYFSVDMLHLPVLSTAPKAVGGIIMNLHLDSNATITPIQTLYDHGVFKQGPYSIHITAGPDCNEIGDGLGLNVLQNRVIQHWIRYFQKSGHSIGNHGGWIHNYFGLNINENNKDQFEKFLPLNDQALEQITGQKLVEYAAPVGNQPNWVTRYLESHGSKAYYTTGNSGVGATHNFRDGRFDADTIWAFPVLPFGKYAAFEEFGQAGLPESEVTPWLIDSTRFMASRHVIRLIYYHPPGAVGSITGYDLRLASHLPTQKLTSVAVITQNPAALFHFDQDGRVKKILNESQLKAIGLGNFLKKNISPDTWISIKKNLSTEKLREIDALTHANGGQLEVSPLPSYLNSIKTWLNEAKTLADKGSFRWYTMTDVANFMDKRRKVRWGVALQNAVQTVQATHPTTLENLAWLIRKDTCTKPSIVVGTGTIGEDEGNWIVTAGNVNTFTFTCGLTPAPIS